MRTTRRRISASTPRRLDARFAYVHFRAMRRRCQRRSVSGGDDRGDLAQPPTAQAVRPSSKPAPVVIGQLQASALELPAQDTVLLNEIVEYGSVLAVQPAGEDGEQQLERRSVNHGGNLYHGPGFHALLVRRSVAMRDRFDVAFANDADNDRHGIVTPTAGLTRVGQRYCERVTIFERTHPSHPKLTTVE
jgi:hypothetical protein